LVTGHDPLLEQDLPKPVFHFRQCRSFNFRVVSARRRSG
jgi:hypothetical protein